MVCNPRRALFCESSDGYMPGVCYSSSGRPVLSHLGLAFVLMLRPFSPGLVMFSDFEYRTSLVTSILPLKFRVIAGECVVKISRVIFRYT